METKPKYVKYPSIPHLMEDPSILDSSNLVIFEKMDGGNVQVRNFSGRTLSGNRANYLTREENFRFDWFKDFNKWAMSNRSLQDLPSNLIVYGEFTAHHNRVYFPEFTNKFFFIDLYDTLSGKFVPSSKAKNTLERHFNLKDIVFLKPLAHGKVSFDAIKKLAQGRSDYSFQEREGVVIKDYATQRFAKLWKTSVDSTPEGILDEIRKTIHSLSTEEAISSSEGHRGNLPLRVYEELRRSGRSEISLAEITNTLRRVIKENTSSTPAERESETKSPILRGHKNYSNSRSR